MLYENKGIKILLRAGGEDFLSKLYIGVGDGGKTVEGSGSVSNFEGEIENLVLNGASI